MVAATVFRSIEAKWLDILPQAVYVCDAPSGTILYYNQRAVDLWGIKPTSDTTETSLYNALKLYNTGGHVLRTPPASRVLRHGTPVNDAEITIQRGDGTRRTVTFSATPLKDEQDRLTGVICTFQDITGRKHVEEQLRESEERFRLLVEGVKDYAIFMLDVEGCVTTWNAGVERIKGYTAEEIIGKSHAICYLPEDIELNKPQVGLQIAVKKGRYEDQLWHVRKDGSRFWANIAITPIHNAADELIGFSKVVRDLTGYHQAQERLRHSEARLSGIIESAMDAIISVGEDQRIVVFNAAAQKMFRCELKDAVGKPLVQFIPERFRDAHAQHIRSFGKTGDTSRSMSSPGTVMAQRFDGTEFPIEATISQVYTGNQKLYTVILRDITERKHIEEERHQYLLREQMARVAAELAVRGRDEFLSVAAHELKTPVTSLRGFAQTLIRRMDRGTFDVEQARTALKTIDQQSAKLAKLVSQLLDVARIQAGRLTLEPKETNILTLIRDVVAGIQTNTSKHNLMIRTDWDEISLVVDPIRLEQVLTNLIDNAVKYSPAGGLVDIEVSIPATETVRIAVTDQGIGIPPEDRQHIFNRYYRAHASRYIGGMGLGLHISHQIVDLHGGKLEAEFPEEGGTRFIVTLPILPQIR